MHDQKIALIDIGSNTIRLVIYGINAYCDMNELLNLKTPANLAFLELFALTKVPHLPHLKTRFA